MTWGGIPCWLYALWQRSNSALAKTCHLATLFQAGTLAEMAAQLQSESKSTTWSALVPIQPRGHKTPFFCVPGVGGNVHAFYALARGLGEEHPFYGLQSVGLDGVATPFTTVEAMATHYVALIQGIQPQGPYLLGGHSFGGWVAFEMAQQLRRAGHDVARVIMLDATAPSAEDTLVTANWREADYLAAFMAMYRELAGMRSTLPTESSASQTTTAQLCALQADLARAGLLPQHSDIALLETLFRVFQTNLRMTYRPTSVLPIPLTLLKAEETDERDPWSSQAGSGGWQQFAEGSVTEIVTPGAHYSMLTTPHVGELVKRMANYLDE